MRNMLSDELGNYFDNYDIVFVDVPYIDNNNYKNRELEIKMTQYRYDCEDIIFRVTNKNYEEKQIYYSMGLLCLSSYLKKHIKAMKEAIKDGVDLIGYTCWSAVDIVSASTGEFKKRYGLIYVDADDYGHGSYKRYKKDSFFWYKKVIESNGEILD